MFEKPSDPRSGTDRKRLVIWELVEALRTTDDLMNVWDTVELLGGIPSSSQQEGVPAWQDLTAKELREAVFEMRMFEAKWGNTRGVRPYLPQAIARADRWLSIRSEQSHKKAQEASV